MKDRNYNPEISGEIRYSDNGGFSYFVPKDLPFNIVLDKKMSKKIEIALTNLAKLNGAVYQMTEEERNSLLLPFMLIESAKSSAIEGTRATIEDIYMSQIIEETNEIKLEDNREVLNYRDALNYATKLNTKEITEDLVFELHKILMSGTRGATKSPGEYRTVQVLIGNRNDTLETADFVPMPPEQIPWKIKNLYDYMNDESENTLICAALSHYQFETIHPFTDGNGRMGRLLIMLILNKGGVLNYPVLYLSNYFNNYRDDYIVRLNGISKKDDFDSWLELFLDALTEQSKQSLKMIARLSSYKRFLKTLETDLNTKQVVDSLFVNPYVRKIDVAQICKVHLSTAGKIVSKLEELGILKETTGKKRNQIFVCEHILNILNNHGTNLNGEWIISD